MRKMVGRAVADATKINGVRRIVKSGGEDSGMKSVYSYYCDIILTVLYGIADSHYVTLVALRHARIVVVFSIWQAFSVDTCWGKSGAPSRA